MTTYSMPDVAHTTPLEPSIVQAMRCVSNLLQHKITAGVDSTKISAILWSVESLVAQISSVEEFERITTAFGHVLQDPDKRNEFQRPPFPTGRVWKCHFRASPRRATRATDRCLYSHFFGLHSCWNPWVGEPAPPARF